MAEQQSIDPIDESGSGGSGPRKPIFKSAFADSRSRVMVIMMLSMAVIALIIAWAFYSIFITSNKPSSVSNRAPTSVDGTTGGDEDPEITKLLVEQDDERAETARKSGRSMVATLTHLSDSSPTTIPPPRATKPAPTPAPAQKQVPREQEQHTQHQTQQRVRTQPQQIDENIGSRIAAIITATKIHPSSTQTFDKQDQQGADLGGNGGRQNNLLGSSLAESQTRPNRAKPQPVAATSNPSQNSSEGPVIIPATALRYAVMENTANSDVKGPVIARLVQGKYRGGRLLGSFDRSQTYLRIEFTSLTAPDIGTVDVKAIAVNPDNSSIGLATKVNHHYIERYGGIILGGFISGYGDAVAQAGNTTTTSPFGSTTTSRGDYSASDELAIAAGGAAKAAGDRLAKTTQRPITVRVARGTPIGVRFLDDVHEKNQQNNR